MRFSMRSLEGETIIDHRFSPGVPPEIARSVGLDPRQVAAGTVYEGAFYMCSHCQAEIIKNPQRTRPRGYCSKCHKYVCDECEFVMVRTLECRSVERQVDAMLESIEKSSGVPFLIG